MKIPGSERELRVLVNCKTYPAVSTKYVETVCTGGVDENGKFTRLYPIPFRFLPETEKYQRWDVIKLRAYKDTKDKRPESWHLAPGTPIEVEKKIISERQRWEWMQPTIFESRDAMSDLGLTNGCVEIQPLELYYKPDKRKWSESQLQAIAQGDLFASEKERVGLGDRVPWQFRLKFRERSTGLEGDRKVLAWSYYAAYQRNKVIEGEVGALAQISDRIRKSIFNPDRTVYGIFGTHSRIGEWMISGLYHVPKTITQIRAFQWE
ncbi:hypothetical protein [Novipirellula maiorica]|nr:hypothetical protein [Rhodopirellula maiorica]